ncbi:MAG TPA: HlyD family efflux transporter periplasmic adaptor subunit [Gemmatimonadales bacterium]|nr:HlyD family efflux transporter periplasmic adaptor subunit [Gemmatimonadales bacterium]
MRRWIVRAVVATLVVAVAIALVDLYRRHQARLAAQAERGEPIVAPSRVREVGGQAMVVLDTADIRRLDLRTAVLRAVSARPERRIAAQLVPEPDRVAAVRAPIAGRLSVPEGSSWPGFGDRVAAGALVAQISDAKPLAVPRAGTVTQVGAQPGEMVQAGQLLLEVTDYGEPLARVPWAAGAAPPAALQLEIGGDGGRVPARLVGASPVADEITRLPAYLYRASRSWPGARPGAAVVAVFPDRGAPARGVIVPDPALVQWEGLVWTYVERGPGRFVRERVVTEHPVPGGLLTTALEPGDTVVVRGAEQLLSEEFRARVTVGDEPGE